MRELIVRHRRVSVLRQVDAHEFGVGVPDGEDTDGGGADVQTHGQGRLSPQPRCLLTITSTAALNYTFRVCLGFGFGSIFIVQCQ